MNYAYGAPPGSARLRTYPEDFRVVEELGFTPSGSGEHHMLLIRKRGWTSDAVADLLAEHFAVSRSGVSYAGRKDRHAETSQWFTIRAPGDRRIIELGALASGVEIVTATRNGRKLRIGALRANRFVITLRDLDASRHELASRLHNVTRYGIPNYFGEQRFGRYADNFARARAWLLGEERVRSRLLRSTLLSAVRAELFNRLAARRVAEGSWDKPLPGERMMLDGRHSHFGVNIVDETIVRRARRGLIHTSGPLPGRKGDDGPTGAVADLEAAVLAPEAELVAALERHGLRAERRALRAIPRYLRWRWHAPKVVELAFELPAGSYATALLREVVVAV